MMKGDGGEKEYKTSKSEREYRKEKYRVDGEREREYAKEYYQRNREKRLKQMREYNATHDLRKIFKKYNSTERRKAYQREYARKRRLKKRGLSNEQSDRNG